MLTGILTVLWQRKKGSHGRIEGEGNPWKFQVAESRLCLVIINYF